MEEQIIGCKRKIYVKPVIKPRLLNAEIDEKEEVLDIDYGYLESVCDIDNRPYRIECWGIADVIMATLYFSSKDMENVDKNELVNYLDENKIIFWNNLENKKIQIKKGLDDVGHNLWVVNVKLKDDNCNYASIIGNLNYYDSRR